LGDPVCRVVLGGQKITFEVSFPLLLPSVPTQEAHGSQNVSCWGNPMIQEASSAKMKPKVWENGTN